MAILVTGASGLIGYQAVLSLAEKGLDVVAAFWKNKSDFKYVSSVQLDLSVAETNKTLCQLEPEAIVHCAAAIPPKWRHGNPEELAWYNNQIDRTVIDYCKNHHDCSLIYISGTSLYGSVKEPVDEDQPIFPNGPYLVQKAESEKQIICLSNHVIVLRVSTPYGIRQNVDTVLTIFVRNALANKPLYYFGSGQRTQDFISVKDIGGAITLAVKLKDVRGIFNIASGSPMSMKRLAELVVSCIPNCKSTVSASGSPDPQENFRANYSIKRAREVLGWSPKLQLKQGIIELAQFIKVMA